MGREFADCRERARCVCGPFARYLWPLLCTTPVDLLNGLSRRGAGGSVNIDDYRRRLLELEQQLVERLGKEAETARDARDDQPDPGDVANVGELKEEYFALAQSDSAVLAEVRAALRRIDDGTYGTCVVDGGPIDANRLESVPWTPYCLKHQSKLEERARMRTPSL
jgi:DnaK suppressor protein